MKKVLTSSCFECFVDKKFGLDLFFLKIQGISVSDNVLSGKLESLICFRPSFYIK